MEIRPYEKNAKKHTPDQVEKIAASIKAFGMNQPIVVDKGGVIIVGHGRYEALKLLGWDIKPEWVITVKNLTDEQVAAYRLADNKLNESEWDMTLALEELKGLSEEAFALTGFDKDLLITGNEADDEIPVVPAESQTEFGDLYELGSHRVLCGDSLRTESMDRLMNGRKSDMVFTDPPWNVEIGLDSNPRHRQREGLINDNLGEDFPVFLEGSAKSIVEYNKGDTYCVMGCEEWPTVHKALTDAGLHWSSTIIWAKDIFVLGRSKYHRQYEPIWYGWKDTSTYRADRKQTDLWNVPRPKVSKEHPTMKPVELVVKAIANSSVEDDIVLDLFLGGGSTLIAAEKTKRACYGMELDPKYIDVCISRWVEYTGNNEITKNGEKIIWKTKES